MIDIPGLLPTASLIDAFWTSNFAGQVIVVVLFAGSIFAWSIMVTKWTYLGSARRMSQRFLRAYRKEGTPAGLFIKRQRFEPSPLYTVYENACRSLGAELEARGADPDDLFMGGMGSGRERLLSEIQVGAVRNVAEATLNEEALALESSMNFLAIAVNAAPLLGLLGTVWGVLEAFGVMSGSGSAMLSTVAPGISGALLTTVVGLLVALPSSIGYNMLVERIRRLCVSSDSFLEELLSDIERNYLEHGKELTPWRARDT